MAFATKPALARELIGRTLDAGTRAAWAAADEDGTDPQLRVELARRGLGYVLAMASTPPDRHRDRVAPGGRAGPAAARPRLQRVSAGLGARDRADMTGR